MAEEKQKGFDAADFLDNYREDIATPVRKTKKQPVPQPSSDTPATEVETPPPKTERKPPSKPDASVDNGVTAMSAEDIYVKEYLVERVPIGFSKSGWQVAVSEDHHDKIVKIIAILGERLTFGGFVDNILRKHFEENKETIRRLISKNTDF